MDSAQPQEHYGGRGAVVALVAAALFGVSTPLAKVLLGAIDPLLLAGLLYFGAGIGLAAARLIRNMRGMPSEARLQRSDMPWLAGVVLTGGVVGPVLLMAGLVATPASTAALLLNLEGLFTLVIAWTVFHENVDRRIALGAAAILSGALILSWETGGAFGTSWGMLAIAGACLAWAIDNNLTRKLSAADPLEIATIKGLVAGAINIGLALARGAVLPEPSMIAAAGVVGLFGYGCSIALFVVALRHIGTARTGAYFSTAPFLGALVAVVWLAEPVTLQLLLAGGLMAVGVWLHLTERHEHMHEHQPMAHAHYHEHDLHHQHEHESSVDPRGPHTHRHVHSGMRHSHAHFPDAHHDHRHD
jgi:drug/metabolite transporter (DMT)-like permease